MSMLAIGGGKRGPHLEQVRETLDQPSGPVLIVPSACSTPASYANKVGKASASFRALDFEDVTVLHEHNEDPSPQKIADTFGAAALVYIIGGNTPYLFETTQRQGTQEHLMQVARATGKLAMGVSAGALWPFSTLHTLPISNPENQPWDYELRRGMGVFKGAAAVHANAHDKISPTEHRPDSRLDDFAARFPGCSEQIGFALDNGSGLFIGSAQYGLITRADPAANVHVLTHDNCVPRPLEPGDDLNRYVGLLFPVA